MPVSTVKTARKRGGEERFIEVPGGLVFTRSWCASGEPAGAPLVLLHDSLGCVETWRDFPAQLAARLGRDVYAYDRLGFGRATPMDNPLSLEFIEKEAREVFPGLLEALELDQVIVLGHSVGGSMAVAIAAALPARCAAVITESAQAFVEPRTLEGVAAAKQRFNTEERLARLGRYHGTKAKWVLDAWTETWLNPLFANWSLDRHLSAVRCPALVMHGDEDEFGSSAFPERIASGVPGPAQMHIFEGVGHVPHRQVPDRVFDAVEAFVSKLQ